MKQVIKRWVPEGLGEEEVLNVVHGYGTDNDTLLSEKTCENDVEFEITITVEKKALKLAGEELLPCQRCGWDEPEVSPITGRVSCPCTECEQHSVFLTPEEWNERANFT